MLLYCGISFWLLLSTVNTKEQTESGYNCCSPSQGEQKVALDYGDGSNDTYGIPKDFTMPDLTAVTMCAWVKHRRLLGGIYFSYYLSYKKNLNGTDIYDLLAFYGRQGSMEALSIFVGGTFTNLHLPTETTIHDNQWHSVCTSWSSLGGLFFRSYDNINDNVSVGIQENYTIPGGGELVVCQRWGINKFVPNRHCYGDIGAVEMWDYYSDSSNIHCMNNCWSVGNLFHFNWTEMLPQDNLIRLNRTEHICDGKQKVALDYGEGSNSNYGIPKEFTMPDLTAVTMCAWVKHPRIQLPGNLLSYYLSYKKSINGTDVYDILGLYARQWSEEALQIFVGGKHTNLNLPTETSIHDDQWHSVCASWSSFGGLFIRSYDNIIDTIYAGFQDKYTIPGGGELVICQRWASGGFFPKRHCYGEIGGVEMWDYYSDSNKIRCVNNCWSVGNLLHFNLEEMLPQGNLLRLNRTEFICDELYETSYPMSTMKTTRKSLTGTYVAVSFVCALLLMGIILGVIVWRKRRYSMVTLCQQPICRRLKRRVQPMTEGLRIDHPHFQPNSTSPHTSEKSDPGCIYENIFLSEENRTAQDRTNTMAQVSQSDSTHVEDTLQTQYEQEPVHDGGLAPTTTLRSSNQPSLMDDNLYTSVIRRTNYENVSPSEENQTVQDSTGNMAQVSQGDSTHVGATLQTQSEEQPAKDGTYTPNTTQRSSNRPALKEDNLYTAVIRRTKKQPVQDVKLARNTTQQSSNRPALKDDILNAAVIRHTTQPNDNYSALKEDNVVIGLLETPPINPGACQQATVLKLTDSESHQTSDLEDGDESQSEHTDGPRYEHPLSADDTMCVSVICSLYEGVGSDRETQGAYRGWDDSESDNVL